MTKKYKIPRLKVRMVRDGAGLAVSTPNDAADALRQICCEDPCTETMAVLFVDGRNQIRGAAVVAQGGRHGLVITAAEVLRPALIAGAAGIILGHNHPSGSPKPSRQDDEMTRVVYEACNVVGIPLLDHIVITDDRRDGHTSYLEEERGCFGLG